MADYISTLSGVQMDAALMDMAEHNSEAYAVGERNGNPVGADDVTFHNNARYYAQQAQSIAPASVTEAVRWDVAQTALTDAQREQARENIDAGKNGAWSNRNLLDNPWFTVNQRGQSSYTGITWGIDRWTFSEADSNRTVTINADKTITISGLFYEKKEYGFSVGDVVTISYMLPNGTVVSKTGTIPNTQGFAVGDSAFGFYWRTNGIADFQIWDASLTIKAFKLELGSVSTLANDAPPDYATELAKCQYYFERKKIFGNYGSFGMGIAVSATNAEVLIPMHTKRNTSYTIATSGSFAMLNGAAITSIAKDSGSRDMLALYITTTGLTAGQACLMRASTDPNAYIDILNDL